MRAVFLLVLSLSSQSSAPAVAGDPAPPGAVWADVDGDGLLDAYTSGRPHDRLLLGGEAGAFLEATEALGLQLLPPSRAAARGDADGDGALDLLRVLEDGRLQLLLRRGATFLDPTAEAGLPDRADAALFRDLDGDGREDLAAIQGLHALLREREGDLEALRARVEALDRAAAER